MYASFIWTKILKNFIATGALREFEPIKLQLKSDVIGSLTGRIVPFSGLLARLTPSDDCYLTKRLVKISSSQVGKFFWFFPASSIRQIKLVARLMTLCVYPACPLFCFYRHHPSEQY